jgi:hypothetical protein
MLIKYNKYTVYVHNFSNFDFYLILQIFNNNLYLKSDSFYKDNKLYSLKFRSNKNKKQTNKK